ncbi:MAG TPA: hypothetical protein VJQ06_13545 [Rhizomicrobium sp.]|nr:hypothetical protein [Rhizomicrobium sp.]
MSDKYFPFFESLRHSQMPDGAIATKIVLNKTKGPSRHRLDIKEGLRWYCDANKGWFRNRT